MHGSMAERSLAGTASRQAEARANSFTRLMRSQHVPACAGKPADHQASSRERNERLAGLHVALVVLGQSSIARQPGERALHYPAAWLDVEATRARLMLDDLQFPPALLLAPVGQPLASVGRVRPDPLEPWHEVVQPD